MRRLAKTLLAGGVVYPAGTAESEIAAEVRRDDVWDTPTVDADTEAKPKRATKRAEAKAD